MSKDVLSLENGKYEVTFDGGKLSATRYGEQWRDLTGDGMVLAMMLECMDAQSQRNDLLEALQDAIELIETISPFEGQTMRKARAAIAKATGETE